MPDLARKTLLPLAALLLLAACIPAPTPDAAAAETAVAGRIFATLTAAAPAAEPPAPAVTSTAARTAPPATATATAPPSPTQTATRELASPAIPVPTATPTAPAARALPSAPPRPTSKPQPTAAPPASAPRALEVTFINPHYECEMGVVEDEHVRVWAHRSFQIDMFIRNNSQAPLTPPWQPSRWILTDGAQERQSELVWQWVKGRGQFYPQPVIGPGQVAGWTFLALPVERNEWVRAVEFAWQGQTYRQEFSLGPLGNADNYRDCGEYPPGAAPREPVLLPTPQPSAGPGGAPTPIR